ncbi:hypothetical protein HJD18_06250 [Thermoleophilia bacterium SCSIO 60948]|nr:hypothetical protein HJD18_06250 [Thermoleophilia bacterium SCSIO 60948]
MTRRRRSLVFGLFASLCAALAATLASGYSSRVADELGPLRPVLVAEQPLARGEPVAIRDLARVAETRQVPERFVPPDPVESPAALAGLAPATSIPAGSYLVGSQFEAPRLGRAGAAPETAGEAIEIVVSAASPLASGRLPRPVDVVVTTEPGPGGGPGRTYVAAERVRLLALSSLSERAGSATFDPGGQFTATLDVARGQALRLIQAESFARSVRLIAR